MKIVIILLSLFPFLMHAQSFFPNRSTNPMWRVELGSFFGGSFVANFAFGNDVELRGKHYEEIIASAPPNFIPVVNGYVRTEGKKVYIVTFGLGSQRALSNEKLMYDFSLEVNKKIYCAAFSIDNPTDSTLCWATSTDSVTYQGIKRKTWNMWYNEWTPTGDPQRGYNTTWIEGIGTIDQPFFPLHCISDGCESFSSTVCFEEAGQLKYLNRRYASCDSLVATGTKDQISKTDVKLYPSLASHQLTVENNNLSNLKIQISNSLGQLFISKELNIGSNTIDITALTSGIYFALISDGRKRRVEKFVKN